MTAPKGKKGNPSPRPRPYGEPNACRLSTNNSLLYLPYPRLIQKIQNSLRVPIIRH